jgi:hypothetical protein|nr:MAG TPA: hypothetical protein [Caudoviricetes sp.]
MSDDLISRKFLLECAEYDNNGRLIIPYRYVKNAPTAFDKEKVLDELGELTGEECTLHECGIRSEKCKACIAKKAVEIVDRGGLN